MKCPADTGCFQPLFPHLRTEYSPEVLDIARAAINDGGGSHAYKHLFPGAVSIRIVAAKRGASGRRHTRALEREPAFGRIHRRGAEGPIVAVTLPGREARGKIQGPCP